MTAAGGWRAGLAAHRAWRAATLNLIASENVTRAEVAAAAAPDLDHRYGDWLDGDVSRRKYRGQRFMAEIERAAHDAVGAAFGAAEVDLRPLGGHLAGVAVLAGLCRPGDTVLELDAAAGGHRTAGKLAGTPLVDLVVEPVPWDGARLQPDVPALAEAVATRRPRVVLVGASCWLYPYDLPALREACDAAPGTVLVYDASHVAGLVAAGRFQDPLAEGAHLVVSSTHKTFGGPQGGMILGTGAALMAPVREAVSPGLVTNHHAARLPALAEAAAWWTSAPGRAEMEAVVGAARALGDALARRGLSIVRAGDHCTDSHTVVIAKTGADAAAARLEACGVIAGRTGLPAAWGGEGVRLGTQEIVRCGMRPADMDAVAAAIARGLDPSSDPERVAADVAALVAAFPPPVAIECGPDEHG